MTATPNIGLTYIDDSQGSPEITINEALAVIDALLPKRAISKSLTAPPGSPSDGDVYIVDGVATGAWADHEDDLALWFTESAAWRFITPKEGWEYYIASEALTYAYNGSSGWTLSASGGAAEVTIITPSTSTAHTATALNNGGLILFDSASDCTLTVPQQSTEELEAGFHVLAKNIGGGNILVALQGSDTIDSIKLWQDPAQAVTVLLQSIASTVNAWSMIGNNWIPTAVEDDALTAPPSTPAVRAVYIPAATATGTWATHEGEYAIHLGGDVYEFLTAETGQIVYEKTTAALIYFDGSSWGAV